MSRILLTGAGGAAIPALIRYLQGLGHTVFTADMDPHAPGLYLGDRGFVVPGANDGLFTDTIADICRDHAVDVLIPLVDEELTHLAEAHKRGWLTGSLLLPNQEFIGICSDKRRLTNELSSFGYRVPETRSSVHAATNFIALPWIVKPRVGRGSRGVKVVNHPEEAREHIATLDHRVGYIIQKYIEGPEYTVSVVVDGANTCHAVVPKEVISKRGQTRLAATRKDAAIDTLCRRIVDEFKPCGPFNVQLRLRGGIPYVFEINPRFSGTVNLTIASGCDEVGGLIELALGRPYTFGEWREGVVMVRSTADVMMDEEEFKGRAPQ